MRFRKSVCFWVAVLAVTAFIASPALAKSFGIGTGGPGSITYAIGSAVAKLVSEKADLQTMVQPHGGNNAFIPALNAGEVDFAAANLLEVKQALTGTGIYDGQQLPNLRVVSVLMPMRNTYFVAKSSSVKSMQELREKKIGSGFTAQKIVQLATTGILANAGLTWDDVEKVPVPNVSRGVDDFIEGKTDAFYFDIVSGKVQEAASKVGGLRALSIDPSPEAMARLQKYMPVMYALLIQPSNVIPGMLEPTYVAAMDTVLLAGANVPDDVIYGVAKALYNGKKDLTSYFKPLGDNFSQDTMAKVLPAGEYHAGAIKFYKEVGLWPPKQEAAGK